MAERRSFREGRNVIHSCCENKHRKLNIVLYGDEMSLNSSILGGGGGQWAGSEGKCSIVYSISSAGQCSFLYSDFSLFVVV